MSIGATISNLGAFRSSNRGASGLGVLGFFAAARDAPDWSELLLVSNHHVLMAHDAREGDPVYAPTYRRTGDLLLFDPDPTPIAEIHCEGLEGHHAFAYPGEAKRSFFIDCATARIVPGALRETRRVTQLGAPARAHPLDALPGRERTVFKMSGGGVRSGKLVDTAATVVAHDGTERYNNLAIRSEPPGGDERSRFADEGDSGALIVDGDLRPLGLLWGVSGTDPGLSFACHIHPVLDFLQVAAGRFDCVPPTSRRA